MEEQNTPVRSTAPNGRSSAGGTVEPVTRPRVPTPETGLVQQPGERYELRDPQAEVTYRVATLQDVLGKAQQLGITRFTAINDEGQRTPISKANDQWQRGSKLPAAPQRPVDPLPLRDDLSAPTDRAEPRAAPLQPARTQTPTPTPREVNTPEAAAPQQAPSKTPWGPIEA